MRAVSRGYLSLTASDVRFDPWSVSLDGIPAISSPEQLDDWSYYQSVQVQTTLVAELSDLYARLQLGPDAKLGLVIIWSSPGTSLRGASSIFPLEGSETSAQIEIEGGLLRGDLRLECQVVLWRPGTPLSPISPQQAGSVVWTTSHSIRLEGLGSRMPILAVPFSKHLSAAGGHGMWWLQVDGSDLHAPADSILWMWLNDENPFIQEMLAEPADPASERTQHFLRMDFYRQLVEIGMRDEDFDMWDEFPAGSLGAVVAIPMRLLGESTGELRAKFVHEPQRLEAEIQARLGGL
jgi:hypothetical protein